MKLISDLNTIFESSSLRAGYPAGFPPDFSPSLESGMGDLSSDIAIRYADPLRCPPESVATAICDKCPSVESGNLFPVRGYINFVLGEGVNLLVADAGPRRASPGEKIRIVLPRPYESLRGGPFLRVAARALVQAISAQSLGFSVRIEMGEEVESISGSNTDWIVGFMHRCASAAMDLGGQSSRVVWERRIDQVVDDDFGGRSFVWFLPSAIRNGMVTECVRRAASRGLVHLCGVERKWAAIPDDELQRAFRRDTPAECVAEALYLASTLPSEDIDLSVPVLNEKSNIAWYHQVTVTRLARWPQCSQEMGGEQIIKALDHEHPLRALFMRAFFAHEVLYRAAVKGAVGEYITWHADFLAGVHRVLNTPQVRQMLEERGVTSEGMELSKILSFAHHILRGMVELRGS